MLRKLKKFVFLYLALKILIFVGIIYYSYYYTYIKPQVAETTSVVIPDGTSKGKVSHILSSAKIIEGRAIFLIISHLHSILGQHIQSGEYSFKAGSTLVDILKKLASGEVIIHKLTIPEGYTNIQIYSLLNHAHGLKGEIEQERYKEGHLLPSTYFYKYGAAKMTLLDRMAKSMDGVVSKLLSIERLPLPLKSIEELLTLASIVEKETGLAIERPRIAAVYLNRLNSGMPLQADPTIIYGMTLGATDFFRKLTYEDLKYDSPYNTYLYKGLPPTPIANPGVDSIKAIFFHAKSNELYFVADGTGGHSFNKTYEKHLFSVKKYRKKR